MIRYHRFPDPLKNFTFKPEWGLQEIKAAALGTPPSQAGRDDEAATPLRPARGRWHFQESVNKNP